MTTRASAWLRGGFVGVDVFFVISGFLITSLLVREVRDRGVRTRSQFYARRARRLLPASTLVILVTLAFVAWRCRWPASSSCARTRRGRRCSARTSACAAGARTTSAEGQQPSPFRHFWSLAVEEQFYLVWPLLLAIALTVLARRRATQATITWVLTVVLAVVVVASLAWCVVRTQAAPGPTYYSCPARAWELAPVR